MFDFSYSHTFLLLLVAVIFLQPKEWAWLLRSTLQFIRAFRKVKEEWETSLFEKKTFPLDLYPGSNPSHGKHFETSLRSLSPSQATQDTEEERILDPALDPQSCSQRSQESLPLPLPLPSSPCFFTFANKVPGKEICAMEKTLSRHSPSEIQKRA